MLSHLKCGTHVELLEFVRGLECLRVKIRRTVPFLIDMKIFDAFLKMSFAASYAPWHVDRFLLGHPLPYGVWFPYRYSVEITYKAFAPIIKFLERGWDLKARAVVPIKSNCVTWKTPLLVCSSLEVLTRPGLIVPPRSL